MYGWKARLGYINPGVYLYSQEWDQVLPEGVVWAHITAGVRNTSTEELTKAFDKWSWAGELMADRQVNYVVCGGTPVQMAIGYEKCQEAVRRIHEKTDVPMVLQIDTLTNALRRLSARKIILVTSFTDEYNEEHKRFLEKFGFEVVGTKGLGITNASELSRLPQYASYRVAWQCYLESPQADAIWIGCPVWPVLGNIAALEQSTGIPVVTDVTGMLWAGLTELKIKGAITGYGKLLETL